MTTSQQEQITAFPSVIKNATAPLHRKLETTKLSQSLLRDDVSLHDFAKYLAVMEKVIAFSENIIYPLVAGIVPDTSRRLKLPLIQQDLLLLNKYLDDFIPPYFQPVQDVITVPFALGFVYVIEGSTLGGKFILKHLAEKLGINETNGGTFFAAYGNNTGTLWKSLLEALSVYAVINSCKEEIIAGADMAFSSIETHFELSDNEDQGYS